MITKVLVVDDEDIICRLFAAMLGQYGCYEVVTTTDSQAVLSMLCKTTYDVVLLDINMPGISGMDLLRHITYAFDSLPVIIVTGHGSIEIAVESMQAGAADFVAKPVPASVLHIRIQRVLEHARTRRLASIDRLTEVANHRAFQERLTQEFVRAERYHRPLSLLLIDIDFFHHYNELHGYPQGDLLLHDLARLFCGISRATDTVARYGGEEFAIILPETDGPSAQQMAHRFHMQVGTQPLPGADEMPGGRLTISIGVATYRPDDSQQALLEAALAALQTAKRDGRNRVSVAS